MGKTKSGGTFNPLTDNSSSPYRSNDDRKNRAYQNDPEVAQQRARKSKNDQYKGGF